MILSLLACLPILLAQEAELVPASPFDQVVELELTTDDEVLIDEHGPTVIFEYEVEFEGTLHIWTRSQLDLFLRVEDAVEFKLLNHDEDSGGGRTPYLRLGVNKGDVLAVFVAGPKEATGPLELHLVAAPETAATREAAAAASKAQIEAARLRGEGDNAAARELLKETIEELGDTTDSQYCQAIADALLSIGTAANNASDFDSGFECLSRARAFRERTLPADHPDLLRAQHDLAISMEAMGDIPGARALREAVLEAYERTLPADDPDLLNAQGNLAISMLTMGDIPGARALQEAVLEARERTLLADHPDLLIAQNNLAISMHEMGDLPAARALREAVLEAYERTLRADDPDLLSAKHNLALSMFDMGDLPGARALREAVLEAYERTLPADHPDLLLAQHNLAVSMEAMGDLPGARALKEAVLEARERTLPADHPSLLMAQSNLAISIEAMGDLPGARALFEAVLEALERTLPADHPNLLSAQHNLALSMQATGDLPGARALLPELCAGMRARILASLTLAPRQARQTVGSEGKRLSSVYFLSASAESSLQSIIFELTETMRTVAGEAARSLAEVGGDPELAPILEQADEVRRKLNDLIAGTARGEAERDAISAEVARLSFERDRLEREASGRLAQRGVLMQPIETKALVSALGPQDALVGYRRLPHWTKNEESGLSEPGADHLLAHVLGADGALTRVDLGPAEELEHLASAWRAALGAPLLRGVAVEQDENNAEASAGSRLRERILDPVLAACGDDVQRLFVCADDLVFLLPLDALPLDDEGTERLGDRVRIVSEVSFARLLSGQLPTSGEPSLLAVGGVDYDAAGDAPRGLVAASAPIVIEHDPPAAGESPDPDAPDAPETIGTLSSVPSKFKRLNQSRREVQETADLFEETFEGIEPVLLMREETTKAALFAGAPGKRFVHIATHGWFAPESVRSTEDAALQRDSFVRMGIEQRVSGLAPMTLCGLALAGANRGRDSLGRVTGILTAEELCSLDLSQCELAVLSACETNVGIRRAGQGIQSLQAALYAAGARTSITSLWKVDDAATRSLMEAFYTNLWLEGMGKAEALWEAKKALREDGDPPAHWAAWVLTGDPD